MDLNDEPNAIWHVTGRVNWQAWQLTGDMAYGLFCKHLNRAAQAFSFEVFSFALMSNHYHLSGRCPDEERFRELTGRRTPCRHFRPWPQRHYKSRVISQFVRALKLGVSKELQAALEISGHLWQGRHYRSRLLDERALRGAIAYDHMNPVRQGMVRRPEEFSRSSASWWAGEGDSRILLVTRDDFPFGGDLEQFRANLLGLQRDQRFQQVAKEFGSSRLSLDSPVGRELFNEMLRDAGI
jgi:REP element-mobilizing transposase RayT